VTCPTGLGPLALSELRLRAGGRSGLVLGYAAHSPHELTRAVRILGRLGESFRPRREAG
jgi:GntR family transcriptional regulator / MocR family aminotransferase